MHTRYLIILVLLLSYSRIVAVPSAGFFLPDSVFEFSMKYKTINDLIILPVRINDSITVNLILDTGCRNLLLFGKKYEKIFQTQPRPVEFSGHGSGKPLMGRLSVNNHVSIGMVEGRRIPIIIIPEKNLFSTLPNIHGVIGYEIFAKFEIEFDFPQKVITFRTDPLFIRNPDFTYVSMNVVDSKPVMECSIESEKGKEVIHDLLIDTGSSLGLIFSSGNNSKDGKTVGRGLSGTINGTNSITKKMNLGGVEFNNIDTSVFFSERRYASIGMAILKDHVVIVNYARSYVAFKNT